MFTPQRTYDVKWALSTKQENGYGTLVTDNHIDHRVALIGTSVGERSRTSYSDADRFGKGHEFPTAFRELTRDLKLARTCDLSSLMAGWAGAFGMGSVTTTQPNPTNNPTAYQHVITFLDPVATGTKQCPVTTIFESVAPEGALQTRYESMALANFTISAKLREVGQLVMNWIGSGKETDGADANFPNLSPISILDAGGLTFQLGPIGAPVDISTRLQDFQVKVTQNLDVNNGYVPGGGIYRKRIWVGARNATFDATVYIDSNSTDIIDDWVNATLLEAHFNFDGDYITAGQPEKHSCHILFPAVRITAFPIGTTGDMLNYKISVTNTEVYKDVGATPNVPMQMTVINTEPSFLTT